MDNQFIINQINLNKNTQVLLESSNKKKNKNWLGNPFSSQNYFVIIFLN